LNLEREIKAKANELYLTESYLLYKKAQKFYLEGDYKRAEFAVDKAFEALKNADKLDLALSHSYIIDRNLRMNCRENTQLFQSGIS